MVFNIPAAGGHLKKNRFEFRLPGDDTVHSLPKLEYTPPEGEEYFESAAGKALNNREFVSGLIDTLDAELGKKFRAARLSRDQVRAFYQSWMDAGRVKDPGESSGSDDS